MRKFRYSFEHAVLSFKVCLRLACSADRRLSTVFLPAARIFAFQAGQPDCLWGLSKLLLQVVETLVSYLLDWVYPRERGLTEFPFI